MKLLDSGLRRNDAKDDFLTFYETLKYLNPVYKRTILDAYLLIFQGVIL